MGKAELRLLRDLHSFEQTAVKVLKHYTTYRMDSKEAQGNITAVYKNMEDPLKPYKSRASETMRAGQCSGTYYPTHARNRSVDTSLGIVLSIVAALPS